MRLSSKLIYPLATGLLLATITAAAKSMVDVERLKVRLESQILTMGLLYNEIIEVKRDTRDIKNHLLGGKK